MAGKPKKILIVEDDKLLQKIYFDRLIREGYVVLQAFTGRQGLIMAHEYKPDLIVLDIMLPGGLNGFDVLEQIRRNKNFTKTPVIMFTCLDKESDTARRVGATDYIVKTDISMDDMVGRIDKYLHPTLVEKIKQIL